MSMNQRVTFDGTVNVGAVEAELLKRHCAPETLVSVFISNPDVTQSLNLKFKCALVDSAGKYVDQGNLRFVSIEPGGQRFVTVDVSGANYYQITGAADGAGVSNCPLRVEHRA